MQTECLFAFALIFLLDSISPGPTVATVIARASTIGLTRTMPFIAGLVPGDLMLIVPAIASRVQRSMSVRRQEAGSIRSDRTGLQSKTMLHAMSFILTPLRDLPVVQAESTGGKTLCRGCRCAAHLRQVCFKAHFQLPAIPHDRHDHHPGQWPLEA